MLPTRYRTSLLVLACGLLGAFAATPALAQSSNVETAALLGGRIVGAAKACGINGDRIRRTSERLLSVMASNASSPSEREAAKDHFVAAQAVGTEEARSERSKCQGVHVDFSEMEVKLGRAPFDSDALAAKRGVPALGALKPDGTAAIRKQ